MIWMMKTSVTIPSTCVLFKYWQLQSDFVSMCTTKGKRDVWMFIDLIKILKLLINKPRIKSYRALQGANDSLGRLKIAVHFLHVFLRDSVDIYPAFEICFSCLTNRNWQKYCMSLLSLSFKKTISESHEVSCRKSS